LGTAFGDFGGDDGFEFADLLFAEEGRYCRVADPVQVVIRRCDAGLRHAKPLLAGFQFVELETAGEMGAGIGGVTDVDFPG